MADRLAAAADTAPRTARTIVFAYLGLLLIVKTTGAAGNEPRLALPTVMGQIAFVIAIFAVQVMYVVPRLDALRARNAGVVLAIQATLTYLPVVLFRDKWVGGMSGFLGGSLLLALAAPASWLLAAAVLLAEAVLWSGVFPVAGPSEFIYRLFAPVNIGLGLFVLIRLSTLVRQKHDARNDLARLALADQRLRTADTLRQVLGKRLATIGATAGTVEGLIGIQQAKARAKMAAAAETAQALLSDLRSAISARDPAENPVSSGVITGRPDEPRLARVMLAVLIGGFAAVALANLWEARQGTGYAAYELMPYWRGTLGDGAFLALTASVLLIVALQWRHSLTRLSAHRPRGWIWTLCGQAVLTYVPLFTVGWTTAAMLSLLAGSVLVLVPRKWSWGLVLVVAASGLLRPYDFVIDLNFVAAVALTGVVFFALSDLADNAVQLQATQRSLARMALVHERLRLVRDVHDMLGLGLSAIALKSDLITRLIGRDDDRVRGELQLLRRICASAVADIRSVVQDSRDSSLRSEVDTARELISSAGIDVHVDLRCDAIPGVLDSVLVAVLREAVTNLLRHSTASRCDIEVSEAGGEVRLRVANDGVPDAVIRQRAGGRGLSNLDERTRDLGGGFAAGPRDGWFEVVAVVPVPLPAGTTR